MSKRKLSTTRDSVSNKLKDDLDVKRFAGISLAGGKTDKAAIAIMEYYPKHRKVFLSHLIDKIKSDEKISGDLKIHQHLTQDFQPLNQVAFDVPLTLPKCLRCRLKCPGYELCSEPEISWLWDSYNKRNKQKRPKKLFTPYTERCTETYISSSLEEAFHPSHALGANLAPVFARGQFIQRRLKLKTMEVYPRLSLWRIGRSLGIQKSYLRSHKHSVEGETIRRAILEKLSEKNVAFLYSQDVRLMVSDSHCFDAFICAFTAILKSVKQCEAKPKGYPKSEGWVEFPAKKIDWKWCQGE
ncbi:MAG: hypothetical protein CL677_06240 [Bdellovibrionaceae bacterium]|nr:hypothetical protein [Pseudobdellovibrionaceae bacterium]